MIANHETEIKDENGDLLLVSHFLKMAINQTPQGGFSLSEQRRRLKLLEVVEKCEPDAEFGFSASQVVEMRKLYDDSKWGALSPAITLIADELVAAADGAD